MGDDVGGDGPPAADTTLAPDPDGRGSGPDATLPDATGPEAEAPIVPGSDGPAPGPAARSGRWASVSGLVILVYVVVLAGALSQIASRDRFNRWGAAMGSLGARLAICLLVWATLFHTLDGLRRIVAEVAPSTAAHDLRLQAAALFITWAVAIPCFAVIVWPWIAETTR